MSIDGLPNTANEKRSNVDVDATLILSTPGYKKVASSVVSAAGSGDIRLLKSTDSKS